MNARAKDGSSPQESSRLEVRQAQLEDAEGLSAFQIAMALETEGLSLRPEVVLAGVRAVLEGTATGTYWLALKGGAPVGCLLVLPEWSDWRNGTVWWIHSVYVLPACRGQGIFSVLYRHLREKVEADVRLKGLRLYVDRRNEHAQHVYSKLGMSSEHYALYEWMK